MKLPLLSSKELCRFFNTLGFIQTRQSGSHKFFKHPDGRTTVVPYHTNKDISRGLLKAILDEIEISRKYFLKNYKK